MCQSLQREGVVLKKKKKQMLTHFNFSSKQSKTKTIIIFKILKTAEMIPDTHWARVS